MLTSVVVAAAIVSFTGGLAPAAPAQGEARPISSGIAPAAPAGGQARLVSGDDAAVSARDAPTTAGSYRPPLDGQLTVITSYDEVGRFAAGHRGVDLAAPESAAVLSSAAGVVTFAGMIAGRGVVVVAHHDGVSTEYEPVRALVPRGLQVTSGQVIGVLAGRHGACLPRSCLHWGARRLGRYLDPLSLLRPLGVVRLIAWPSATGDR